MPAGRCQGEAARLSSGKKEQQITPITPDLKQPQLRA
jgi:hypothetical protein